jgi:hypothetical protein
MTLTLPARLFNLAAFAQPIRVLRGPATNCRNSRLSNWGGLELIIFKQSHLADFNLWRAVKAIDGEPAYATGATPRRKK